MGRKPNKKRNAIAKALINELSRTENTTNLRATMDRIAKKYSVKKSYVQHLWYDYVTPLDKRYKRAPLNPSFENEISYCFFTTGVKDFNCILNRKCDTHNIGYTPE